MTMRFPAAAAAKLYAERDVFTTGQVALICRTGSRTVRKWCEAGLLAYDRIPGGPDRRITRAALSKFLRDRMPEICRQLEGEAHLSVGFAGGATVADAAARLVTHPVVSLTVNLAVGRAEAESLRDLAGPSCRTVLVIGDHQPAKGYAGWGEVVQESAYGRGEGL